MFVRRPCRSGAREARGTWGVRMDDSLWRGRPNPTLASSRPSVEINSPVISLLDTEVTWTDRAKSPVHPSQSITDSPAMRQRQWPYLRFERPQAPSFCKAARRRMSTIRSVTVSGVTSARSYGDVALLVPRFSTMSPSHTSSIRRGATSSSYCRNGFRSWWGDHLISPSRGIQRVKRSLWRMSTCVLR
jgi:hypothetical protein